MVAHGCSGLGGVKSRAVEREKKSQLFEKGKNVSWYLGGIFESERIDHDCEARYVMSIE